MDKGPFKDSIVAQLLKLSSFGGTWKHGDSQFEPLNDFNSIQFVFNLTYNGVIFKGYEPWWQF